MSCCGSGHMCGVCKVVGLILGILVLVAMIASLIGLYNAHMVGGVWTFGTTEGSLSLLAFAFAAFVFKKCMAMCPCRSKGMCPGCGKDPCVCK